MYGRRKHPSKKSMPKLLFISQDFSGRFHVLESEKTTVGRGNHNSLVLHDNSISKSHCEIQVNGVEVIVRDLGSKNGTVVNGERLRSQQRQLKHGQIVKFGSVEARLELEEPPFTRDSATDVTAGHGLSR